MDKDGKAGTHKHPNNVSFSYDHDKTLNKKSTLSSVKFLNYNVCGLNSKLDNADFINMIIKYDVITLTETFIMNEFKNCLYFKDYCIFTAKAKKLSLHGRSSGGVIVMVKRKLEKYIEKISTDLDNTIILKLSKDLMATTKDIMYIATYIPPCDSKFWNTCQNGYGIELLEKCMIDIADHHNNFFVLLNGDFNSRTANRNYTDIDLEDPLHTKTDVYKSDVDAIFSRNSNDDELNVFGEQLIEFCESFDCVILNGLKALDFDASFTYVSDMGSSVIDYFIMSCDFFRELVPISLAVKTCVESDHLPIELNMPLSIGRKNLSDTKDRKSRTKKILWKKEKECNFKECLSSTESEQMLNRAIEQIEVNVDDALDIFVSCLKSASKSMERTVQEGSRSIRVNAPWFDAECRTEKQLSRKLLKQFRKTHTEECRIRYLQQKKKYKKLLKEKKQLYKRELANRLESNCKDPAKFWKEIKTLGGSHKSFVTNNISLDEWFDHLKVCLIKIIRKNSQKTHLIWGPKRGKKKMLWMHILRQKKY